jgi:hypothetical protein
VADSAYPAQSRAGVETIVIQDDHQVILNAIVNGLRVSPHLRPVVFIDKELDFVDELDAPGMSQYREFLFKTLTDHRVHKIPHEEIISRVDAAAEKFFVTIFKSTLTIPYTSVFFELDCAYWSEEAEGRLRIAMRG